MSLEVLIIGEQEKHQKLATALEQGLHEVSFATMPKGLLLEQARHYSAIFLCMHDGELPQIARFVQNVKQHRELKNIPLVAYFSDSEANISPDIRDLPFDDLFYPQQDGEYDYIAAKVTAIYRRLQILSTMQTRSELLEMDEEEDTIHHAHIALLLSEDNTTHINNSTSVQEHHLEYFDRIENFETHIQEKTYDVLIIDASLGLKAMKLASRLSSNVGKYAPVMVLIPEDKPQLAIQCIEIRAHDFILLPINHALFCLKIAAMQRWSAEYNRHNSSVEQQLSLSIRDELTSLYNRRYLNRLLLRMSEQATSQRQKFSLCIIDVDHFKKFNDTYGHAVGDSILCQLAYQMELRVRRHDNVGRWGGEEFVIIFADVTESLGVILAERIRSYIAESNFTDPSLKETLNIAVSIGVAHCRVGETPEQLIDRADKALYQAKLTGRNRVAAAE